MYIWYSDNTTGKAQQPRKQVETFQTYSQELREEVSEEEEDGGAMLGQQLPSSEGQCQMVADNPDSKDEQTGWSYPGPHALLLLFSPPTLPFPATEPCLTHI